MRLIYIIFAFISAIAFNGCGTGVVGGANQTSSQYGVLISSGSAPVNQFFSTGSNIVSMAQLNNTFADNVACSNTSGAKFCEQNKNYINSNPNIFGLSGSTTLSNFVIKSATDSQVSFAKFDRLIYTAPGAPYANSVPSPTQNLSGLVVLPLDANQKVLASNLIKGVILFYHPTVFSKTGVPSGTNNQNDIDDYSTYGFQYELAAMYASNGFIVIAPDFIGQGIDSGVASAFGIFPQINAISGIYMLPALKTYLSQTYGISLANIAKPNLYTSAFSAGSAYSIMSAQLMQSSYKSVVLDSGLTLTRAVGTDGAYDIENSELPFLFQNVSNAPNNSWFVSPGCYPGANAFSANICPDASAQQSARALAQYQMALYKPDFIAYVINALQYYGYINNFTDVMTNSYAMQVPCLAPQQDPFTFIPPTGAFANTTCNNLSGGYYSFSRLFNTLALDQLKLTRQIFASSASIGISNYFIGANTNAADLINDLKNGNSYNQITTFINQSAFLGNPATATLIHNANVYNWTTKVPISLITLKYDSTVTPANFNAACNPSQPSLLSNSAKGLVKCVTVDNTNLWVDSNFGGLSGQVFLNHTDSEKILQMAVLYQILSN